jgi:hypothetical protein
MSTMKNMGRDHDMLCEKIRNAPDNQSRHKAAKELITRMERAQSFAAGGSKRAGNLGKLARLEKKVIACRNPIPPFVCCS